MKPWMVTLRQARGWGRWWWSFAALSVMALVFALIVGSYLARLQEPAELESSPMGEWADLGDQGLRLRLDEMVMAPSFPGPYGDGEQTAAPEGMELLRVRMTIDPVAGDLQGSCIFELYNGDGEKLGLKELGVEGPGGLECVDFSDDSSSASGAHFEAQSVYVVIPEPVENYSLRVSLLIGALLKDTSTHGQEESGIEPPTWQLAGDLLYPLSHGHPTLAGQRFVLHIFIGVLCI